MKTKIVFQYVLSLMSFFQKRMTFSGRFSYFVIIISACGFLYPVNAQEFPLVINGDFEYADDAIGGESTHGWHHLSGWGYRADFILAYDPDTSGNRVLQVNVNNVYYEQPRAIRTVQRNITLEPNTTYVFSVDINGSAGAQVGIDIAGSFFAPMMGTHFVESLNGQWQTVEFDFTTDDTGNARILINLAYKANISKTILFDKISIGYPSDEPESDAGLIIKNGDFEQADNSARPYFWQMDGEDAAEVISDPDNVDNQLLALSVGKISDPADKEDVRLYQSNLSIQAGETYRFSMRVRAAVQTQATIDIAFNSLSEGVPYLEKYDSNIFDYWRTYTMEFSSRTDNDGEVSINFAFPENSGEIFYIDDITLVKVKGSLIRNGEFELEDAAGLPALWEVSLNSDEASVSLAPDPDHAANQVVAIALDDDFASSNAGDIEISQSNVPIEAGKTYRYSLRMRTEVPGPGFINASFDSTLNGEEYVAKFDNNLSPYWETYTMEFVASTDNDGQASIKLAFPENAGHVIFIDDVVLREVNNNLVQNSGFDELNSSGQSAHWGLHVINADASFSVVGDPHEPDNAVLAVNIHSATVYNLIWDIQIFQTDLAIEPGKSYRYSLRMRTDAPGPATVDAAFGSRSRDYRVYASRFDKLIFSEWKTYSMDFVAATDSDGHLSIRMAFPENVGKTLYIDDVVVSEINPSLIQNSGFNEINSSNQPAVWGLHDWHDNASFSVVTDPDDPLNEVLAINVAEIDVGDFWDIQLFQTDLPLKADTPYEYRFRIKSDKPDALVFAGVQSVADWWSDGFVSTLYAGEFFGYPGDGWMEISLPFTPGEDNLGHAVIQFAFSGSNDNSTFYVDDVSLRPVILKALAPFPMGVAVGAGDEPNSLFNFPEQQQTIGEHFSQLVAGNIMKMSFLHPQEDIFFFEHADVLVGWALEKNLSVHGHALLWHSDYQVPEWMKNYEGNFQAALDNHVTTIVDHFEGKVTSWDVVNEVSDYLEDDCYRKTLFYERLGPEYIANAFFAARAADPDADLYYNEFGAESHERMLECTLLVVDDLIARNAPVDGVGIQMHVLLDSPAIELIRDAFQAMVDRNLKVRISEMDVAINVPWFPPDPGDYQEFTPELAAQQKQRYQEIIQVYLETVPFYLRGGVTVWNFLDSDSWLIDLNGVDNWPVLFSGPAEGPYEPKPSYFGVVEALRGAFSVE